MRNITTTIALSLLAMAGCATEPSPNKERLAPTAEATVLTASGESLLEQYAATNRFRNGAPSSLKFTPDGSALLYLRSGPRDRLRDLYELNLETGAEKLLISASRLLDGEAEELTAEEIARRERARDAGRGLSSFSLSDDGETILLPLSGRIFLYNRADDSVRELVSEHGSPIDARFSPNATMVAAARDGDLYIQNAATGAERRLTTTDHPRVTFAEAEFIAQEEMSRTHGYWWSPDSSQIVYQRTDTRDVVTFRIMDPANPGKPPREWPYPRAGTNNAKVTLFIQTIADGTTHEIKWDHETYPYLATVKWPKNAPLTIAVQNRAQTELQLLTADPATGETTTLHTEHDAAWIDLDQSVPKWLADGSGILWSTERNGARQLELRNADGTLRHMVTTPADGYEELLGVAGDEVIFRARMNQIETHVVRAQLDPSLGRPRLVSEGVGLHDGTFSDRALLCAHHGELLDGTRVREVRTVPGDFVATIPDARETPAQEVDVELTTVEGTRTYHASIVRPSSFDPERPYPVIMRVYGGPTSVFVRPTATALAMDQWFADRGFVVVRTDGRGTPGRGSDWLREVKGDFITAPLDDLAEAVVLLCARYPEMDAERVGVFGWSWGGYYSAMAACRRPDVFASAVIGAPVADWMDYDTHYTERYMGVPGKAGVDYVPSSVLTYAEELRVPVLLIHGTSDDNVYFTHSAKLADAWLRAGVPFEFLPLAGMTHSVTEADVVVPMYERMAEFFARTLGSE